MKRIILIAALIGVITSMMLTSAYATLGNGGGGLPGGKTNAGGSTPSFYYKDQGYRIYFTSGSVANKSLKVVSPVYDFLFNVEPSEDCCNFSFGTSAGSGSVSGIIYIDENDGMPMPIRCGVKGNTCYYYPNGVAFKKWALRDLADGYNNITRLTYNYFGPDVCTAFVQQKVRLIVEPIIWTVPYNMKTKACLGSFIYGNTRQISYCLNYFGDGWSNGGRMPSLLNDAFPHSLILEVSDGNIKFSAPRGSQLVGKQSDDTILNHNIGFGMHIYNNVKTISPSPSVTSEPPNSEGYVSPDTSPDDSSDPPAPDVPVGPDLTVPSDPSHDKPEQVFSHYASVAYNKSANFNLNLDSTQWSLSRRATSGSDGWQGKNQVLPGGAIYSLNTSDTYVKLNTWQGFWDGGESAAVHKHQQMLQQANNALDNWQVTQYINSDTSAGNAFGGMTVAAGGQSLSALGLKNKTSSESKYYLRDGTSNNKANESDLDIIAAGTGYAVYTINSYFDEDGVLHVVISKSCNGQSYAVSLGSSEAASLNTYTNTVSVAESAAPCTVYAVHATSVIDTGFSRPNTRSSVLDPNLCPSKSGTSGLYTKAFISQFRLEPMSRAYRNKATGYIGSFWDRDYFLSNAESMFMSKPFYVPNANVSDLD